MKSGLIPPSPSHLKATHRTGSLCTCITKRWLIEEWAESIYLYLWILDVKIPYKYTCIQRWKLPWVMGFSKKKIQPKNTYSHRSIHMALQKKKKIYYMFEKIHFTRQSTGLTSKIWIIILKQVSSRAEVTLTKGLTEDTALTHLPKYWNK